MDTEALPRVQRTPGLSALTAARCWTVAFTATIACRSLTPDDASYENNAQGGSDAQVVMDASAGGHAGTASDGRAGGHSAGGYDGTSSDGSVGGYDGTVSDGGIGGYGSTASDTGSKGSDDGGDLPADARANDASSEGSLGVDPFEDAEVEHRACERPCSDGDRFRCANERQVEMCADTAGCRAWVELGPCPEHTKCCAGICVAADVPCESVPDPTVPDGAAGTDDPGPLPMNAVIVAKPGAPDCRATMLNNLWAISVDHCFDLASDAGPSDWTVEGVGAAHGTAKVKVNRFVRHPTNLATRAVAAGTTLGVDLVLLELEEPLRLEGGADGFAVPLYTGATLELEKLSLMCEGAAPADGDAATSSDVARGTKVGVVAVKLAVSTPDEGVHQGDLVWYAHNESPVPPCLGVAGCGCYTRSREGGGRWELAVIQTKTDGSAEGRGMGTSLADDTVRNWIAQHVSGWVSSESAKPAASSRSDTLRLFWQGVDGTISYKLYPHEGAWSSEYRFDWPTTHAPAVSSSLTSGLNVFWRGMDYRIRYRTFPDRDGGLDWTSEEVLEGPSALSGPSVAAAWEDERLDVFWRGMDNSLVHRRHDANFGWSDDNDFVSTFSPRPVLASGPVAVWRRNAVLDVLWRGPDRHLKHIWYFRDLGETGDIIQDLGGEVEGDPAIAASDDKNTLHVFWRTANGALMYRWYVDAEPWSNEVELASGLSTGPAVVSPAEGELEVFWRAIDGHLKRMSLIAGRWSAIEDVGGAVLFTNAPSTRP